MKVSNEKVVTLHYTLKKPSGEVLDSSEGQDPLAYLHGAGNLIPGLEKALDGKEAGAKMSVVVAPDEGYGKRDESLVQSVPLSQFQNKSEVKLGAQFQAQTPEGTRIATVTQVEGDSAKVDLNHPLAGESLHFDVEIVEIREATDEELTHGHVHGPEGHAH